MWYLTPEREALHTATLPRLACNSDNTELFTVEMVEIARLKMTGTLLCGLWTGLSPYDCSGRSNLPHSWPFNKTFSNSLAGTISCLMTVAYVFLYSTPNHATCDYLCHGSVGLVHLALSHLHTSNQLKSVGYLNAQVTKGSSFKIKRGSLDLHAFLLWYNQCWGIKSWSWHKNKWGHK